MGEPVGMDYLVRVAAREKERIRRLDELPEVTGFFFRDALEYEADMIPWKSSTADVARVRLRTVIDHLQDMPDAEFLTAEGIGDDMLKFIADHGYTNAETLWPMRVALTARKASPSPFEVASVIGKERTLARLKSALSLL